jgi:hypothetical protein
VGLNREIKEFIKLLIKKGFWIPIIRIVFGGKKREDNIVNIYQKIKAYYELIKIVKNIKGETMKGLLNSFAGWLKIITYAAAIAGLLMGWLQPQTALTVSLIASALVKLLQEITKVTPSTKDDEFVAAVDKILKEKGIIKVS